MVFEIGVNLRVTECLDKGDRNYMEDISKCYFEKVDGSIVFGFFGIFDGHGGSEAAHFAKKVLINEIKKVPLFWSENDKDVLSAIKQGFLNTHLLMWNERDNWSKTISGFDSTAGTTATVAIVRNRKLYIGHVGDSACVLGFAKVSGSRTDTWDSVCLTVNMIIVDMCANGYRTSGYLQQEHKPSNAIEKKRIEDFGGILAKKGGIQRVVWSRPKFNNTHKDLFEGDSTEYENVPFLAITRSLGDLWSYDPRHDVYHISPEPDVQCISLNTQEHRCIILGSDGLWNVVSTQAAIEVIRICERETERRVFLDPNINSNFFYNPAASLVRFSMSRWKRLGVRADNVSALVIMIDPPGPSMTKRREDRRKSNFSALDILSCLTCEIPSNESFSKQLTKEFLIECNRWRSANELKNETEGQKSIEDKLKVSQDAESILNNSICLSSATVRAKSKNKTLTLSPENHAIVDIGNPKTDNTILHNFISSDSFYLQHCISWINNPKVWAFISVYFQSKGLKNENDVTHFLESVDPDLCIEILKLMPWIFVAMNTFKNNSQIQLSINSVPIFDDFWVELYLKHIKGLEKSSTPMQFTSMQAILNILKPIILVMLKRHNYLIYLPKCEKALFGDEENNKNNETIVKYLKKKHTISDSKGKIRKRQNIYRLTDTAKLKFMLSPGQKNRGSNIKRFVQSDKNHQQKKGGFQLKRSASDKQMGTFSPPSPYHTQHDLPYVHSETKTPPIARNTYRYTTVNDAKQKGRVLTQNMSNSDGFHYQEYSNNAFCKRRKRNKQCRSIGKNLNGL